MKNEGKIIIPKGSYEGSGEAILFLRKSDKSICDKVMYIDSIKEKYNFEEDDYHLPLKVMLSCWQACIPSLNIVFDLTEVQ